MNGNAFLLLILVVKVVVVAAVVTITGDDHLVVEHAVEIHATLFI